MTHNTIKLKYLQCGSHDFIFRDGSFILTKWYFHIFNTTELNRNILNT